jgi:hypothetical protein
LFGSPWVGGGKEGEVREEVGEKKKTSCHSPAAQ